MWVRLLPSILAVGCVTTQVVVTPREILHHVPDLRMHGHAAVTTSHGTYELDADRTFDVTIGGKPRRASVRELIANCPDVAPFAGDPFRPDPPCLLLDTTIQRFPLGSERHVSGAVKETVYVLLGGLLVTALIASVAGFVCAESASHCR